jgi:hypothetical protein
MPAKSADEIWKSLVQDHVDAVPPATRIHAGSMAEPRMPDPERDAERQAIDAEHQRIYNEQREAKRLEDEKNQAAMLMQKVRAVRKGGSFRPFVLERDIGHLWGSVHALGAC